MRSNPLAVFAKIEREVVACRRCPRLVAWREAAAKEPPRRFRGQTYWARPIPAWGDPRSRILLVGLAPAAHGGNRTGRMFTGDESGNFLIRALYEAGLADQPVSRSRDDGTRLVGAMITAACRCAPPDNKPLPQELASCFEFAAREAALLPRPRVFVALGGLAFRTCLALLAAEGATLPRPRPRFAHGAIVRIGADTVLATYHPSQQNTFTGRLTPPMLSSVFRRAVREAQKASSRAAPRSATS